MKVFMNDPVPDEIPEGFDYYVFMADRPDGARLYGVFIADSPQGVHDIDIVKECPIGTEIAVATLTREQYLEFVEQAAEAAVTSDDVVNQTAE